MKPTARQSPRCGDIWWINLEPVRGHEQGKRRPCLVVSVDEFNSLPHGLVWVAPITTNVRLHSFAVEIKPPEGGLRRPSAILCHQLRTVSVDRLEGRLGAVAPPTLEAARARIAIVLGL